MTSNRIAVVGAGIVGLAVGRKLQLARPGAAVTVVEKEARIASHQTGHNSGVVHAGIYYAPGSAKARLCLDGREQLRRLCERHSIVYDECGKLIVATAEHELTRLADLERRAADNGVPGVRRVGAAEISEIEPHAVGVAALHSPRTAVVDFAAVAEALAGEIRDGGGAIELGWPVRSIERRGGAVVLVSASGADAAYDQVVVCAGLHSDELAVTAGFGPDPAVVAFRGEYYRVRADRAHLVRALIYPVPDPAYPFLGVHFTRRVDGAVDVGPNAVLALAREGYRWRDFDVAESWRTFTSPAFVKLARAHWRTGLAEIWGSISRSAYLRRARLYVPELEEADIFRVPAGVRAQALARDGRLVDDFVMHGDDKVLVVRNAPSPAATSSLAIADEIVARLPGLGGQG